VTSLDERICFSGSPPLCLHVGLFSYVITVFQAVDLTRLKASEIDYRVAQLEKEFTLSGAQRSGFWEEFEVGFALNLSHSQVCSTVDIFHAKISYGPTRQHDMPFFVQFRDCVSLQ